MAASRIVLITGANSGVGYALAANLISKPGNHVVLASRSLEKGTAALSALQPKRHPDASVDLVQLDITDDASIAAAAAHVRASHRRLDILVNNAGGISSASTLRGRLTETFTTNAVGAVLVTEAFIPLLSSGDESAGPARIVNISSGFGSISRRLDTSARLQTTSALEYRVSKAALNMASACMAVDYSPEGEKAALRSDGPRHERELKVFTYCPGFTQSNLSSANTADGGGKPADQAVLPLVEILDGERDGEVNRFLWAEGQYGW